MFALEGFVSKSQESPAVEEEDAGGAKKGDGE